MTADQHRQRIADALRAYANPPAPPTIRVIAAATSDGVCSHCGDLVAVSIRRTCGRCRAHHVTVLCGCCSTATTWGDHAGAADLSDADRAELRRVAHRVGRHRRGAA